MSSIEAPRRQFVGALLLAGAAGASARAEANSVGDKPECVDQPDCNVATVSHRPIVERAQTALGKRVRYKGWCSGPHPDRRSWPSEVWTTDCSGFVAWCFRLNRFPPQLRGRAFDTNFIYDDAVRESGHVFFEQVLDTPAPGDIVVYPDYRETPNGPMNQGHVALITAWLSPTDYKVIDCSFSAYVARCDAITDEREHKFTTHRRRVSDILSAYPQIGGRFVRPPIFARFKFPD